MGDKNKKMDELIAKHLFDQLSDEEEQMLQQSMEDDPSVERLMLRSKGLSDILEEFDSNLSPDEDMAWNNLMEKMEEGDLSQQGVRKLSVLHSVRQPYFIKVAAVVFVLVGFYFSFKYVSDGSLESDEPVYLLSEQVSERRVELSTADGVDAVYLPDNSLVYLNDNTNLVYDEGFSLGKRTVYLEGEAFFKVAHDPEKPFVVYTRTAKTEVLGTSFNIRANKGADYTEVTVYSGKVSFTKVGGTESDTQFLLKDDVASLNHETGNVSLGIMIDNESIKWVEGYKTIDPLKADEPIVHGNTGPNEVTELIVDPRVAVMNAEIKNPDKYLSNVVKWENLVMWDGHLKKVTDVSGEIYNSAVFVEYSEIELSATLFDKENKFLGKEVFKIDNVLEAGSLAKYKYELKAWYDGLDRVVVEVESAKGDEQINN